MRRSNVGNLKLLTGALAVLVIAACGGTSRREFDGEPPIQKITFSGSDLLFQLRQGASLAEAMKMEIFASLRDDPPIEKVTEQAGPETRTYVDSSGSQWKVFETPAARIEAGVQTEQSGSERWSLWQVHAYPTKHLIEDVYVPGVGKHVPRDASSVSVAIETFDRREATICTVKEGSVWRCRWFTQSNRPPPAAP